MINAPFVSGPELAILTTPGDEWENLKPSSATNLSKAIGRNSYRSNVSRFKELE